MSSTVYTDNVYPNADLGFKQVYEWLLSPKLVNEQRYHNIPISYIYIYERLSDCYQCTMKKLVYIAKMSSLFSNDGVRLSFNLLYCLSGSCKR